MENSQKGFSNVILLVVIVTIVAVGGYYVLPKKTEPIVSNTQLSKYLPLSTAKLEDLRKLFIERNGSSWSVELDNFGFIYNIKTSDPDFVPQDEVTQYVITDSEKNRWEKFVLKNADFFGIDNLKGFKFEYSTFGEEKRLVAVQRFNNSLSFNNGATSGTFLSDHELPLEVFKSVRTIPKFEVSISIQHHFWPKATLPLTPQISKSNIEQKFIGNDYTYQELTSGDPCDPLPGGTWETSCGGSHGPSAISHTVKIQSGDLDIKVVPYFFNYSGVGELRLVYLTKLLLPGGRTKFFDAITGEELKSGI